MRFPLLPFAVAALVAVHFLPDPVSAQETPTITIKKGNSVTVALDPLTGGDGPGATKILQNDLEISGWLQVGSPAQAGYTIRGTASGGSVTGWVVDRGGREVLRANYSGGTRSAVHQFADEIVETLTGNRGIATSKIAFISNKTGRKEVYLADYDGANVIQLTRDNAISVSPSLGPDARKLAYTGYQSGYADVYLIDIPSGARNRILKYPGTNTGAAISPNGGRIAVSLSKDGNPELYVTSINGGGAKRLTRTRGVEASPTWSPGSDAIIYTSDNGGTPQLYRISASGGSPTLISTGHSYNTEPSWSPDGRRVAFNVKGGSGFQVAIKDLTGGSTSIASTGGSAENPAFGPSSRHVAYSMGGSIWIVDIFTGKRFQVISGVGNATQPTWSL